MSIVFDFLNDCLTLCIFRLTFYSSDKYILISKLLHLCLHLIITYICNV